MHVYSVHSIRCAERAAMQSASSDFELMERAGAGAARVIGAYAASRLRHIHKLVFFCGCGNNGGDGLVAARHLAQAAKWPISVLIFGDEARRTELFAANLEKLPPQLYCRVNPPLESVELDGALVIDALLGIGFRGELREPLAGVVKFINDSMRPVVALDLPSGCDGDTGAGEHSVVADLTITFGAPKSGLFERDGSAHSGTIAVEEIGLDFRGIDGAFDAIFASDISPLLRRIPAAAHKNTRGPVAVFGGSRRYPDAPMLTSLAALRAGSGRVEVVTPVPGHPPALALIRSEEPDTLEALGRAEAVAAGPGWGVSRSRVAILKRILASGKKCVLDADALNLLAGGHPDLFGKIARDTVLLTPHPGEAARLAAALKLAPGLSRRQLAEELSRRSGAVVLLKGRHSVVAAPDGRLAVICAGTPALATAGSGDVLTGIAASFAAQGMNLFDAGCAAAFVHGRAGELAKSARSLIADDLPEMLADVFDELTVFA